MRRWLSGLMLTAAFATTTVLGVASQAARPASACSLGGNFTLDAVGGMARDATIVAIGTLSDATPDRVTLVVEEAWKGTRPGERVDFYNGPIALGSVCEMSVARYRLEGGRFGSGDRVLVLLAPGNGTGGLPWPVGLGDAVLAVEGDVLLHPRQVGSEANTYALDEVREAVASTAPALPPPHSGCVYGTRMDWLHTRLAHYLVDARMVVAGTVLAQQGPRLRLQADEYLLGAGPGVIDINVTAVWMDGMTCAWQWEDYHGDYEAGERFLVFLEPDDTGIAAWHPLARDGAIFRINGHLVMDSTALTLSDVRGALGTPLPPIEKPAPGGPDGNGGDGQTFWLAGGAAMLALAAAGAALWWRRRA
jgi:hypothetical protein